MRISKRTRAEAARIASIWASTPSGWDDGRWTIAAISLYSKAFWASYRRLGNEGIREAAAEAECRLREGWTP